MSVRTITSLFCNGASAYLLFLLCQTSYLTNCGGAATGFKVDATLPKVTIPQGTLQGYNMLTSQNRTVYGFTGVPYAQPPVGDLRFKSPVAPTAWNGTLNASRQNSLCLQRANDGTITGDEDCLYLNIYTPKLPSSKNSTLLPVLFFLVGGSFVRGITTPERHGPDFLLNQDVILVVPNFRLGALGFLSTGDAVSPGNYGLKDIVRALEWNRDNIKYFGGDLDQMTLAGVSAGAISVSLLTLTNATNGLFHRYITQSGTALLPRIQGPTEAYATHATKVAEYYGCPTNTSTLLVECLRGLNGSQLVDTESLFYVWSTWPDHNWYPTEEPDVEGALITESPATLIAEGKSRDLPWLSSNVRDEGHFLTLKFRQNSTLFEEFLDNIDLALPELLEYSDSASNVTALTEALKSYYLPELCTANLSLLLENVTLLAGDLGFMYPTYSLMQQRLSVATSSMYRSSFEYRGVFDYSYYFSGGENYTDIWHGDELIYLFRDHDNVFGPASYQYSEDDLKMVKEMVNMWTSFVINGEPTPASANGTILWEPYSECQNYLQIGNYFEPELTVKYGLQKERMEFLDQLLAAVPWK